MSYRAWPTEVDGFVQSVLDRELFATRLRELKDAADEANAAVKRVTTLKKVDRLLNEAQAKKADSRRLADQVKKECDDRVTNANKLVADAERAARTVKAAAETEIEKNWKALNDERAEFEADKKDFTKQATATQKEITSARKRVDERDAECSKREKAADEKERIAAAKIKEYESKLKELAA